MGQLCRQQVPKRRMQVRTLPYHLYSLAVAASTTLAEPPRPHGCRGADSASNKSCWRMHWSARGPRTAGELPEGAVPHIPASLPNELVLLTFAPWRGTLMHGRRALEGAATGGAGGAAARTPPDTARALPPREDPEAAGSHYLVRIANVADPLDEALPETPHVAPARAHCGNLSMVGPQQLVQHDPAQRQQQKVQEASAEPREPDALLARTVDLCQVVTWPQGAILAVLETTLTANRGLRAFQQDGGTAHFAAQELPVCFKEAPQACDPAAPSPPLRTSAHMHATHAACAGGAVEVKALDCSSDQLLVCVSPMHVRTFVIQVVL
jgi:hypothetical protein